MSSATFLLISLAVGAACTALLIAIRRRRWPAGWRRVLLVTLAVLLGFNFTSAFGDITFGGAAMPGWSHATRSLWIIALGAAYAFDLTPLDDNRLSIARPLGVFMIAGGLAATGAYLF